MIKNSSEKTSILKNKRKSVQIDPSAVSFVDSSQNDNKQRRASQNDSFVLFSKNDILECFYIEDKEKSEKFKISNFISNGTTGTVIAALTEKEEFRVLKITEIEEDNKNKLKYELDVHLYILGKLRGSPDLTEEYNKSHLMKIYNPCYTIYKEKRYCVLVTEKLQDSLLSRIHGARNRSCPFRLIKSVIKDTLEALAFLNKMSLVHCDVKPENIVFKEEKSITTRLIDFGSMTGENQSYDEIVTIYYRPPEIVLKLPTTYKLDVWSVACVACEMFFGQPIFHAKTEAQLLYFFTKCVEPIPKNMIEQSKVRDKYFDSECILLPKPILEERNETSIKENIFISNVVQDIIDHENIVGVNNTQLKESNQNIKKVFSELIGCMLRVDPNERYSVEEALNHEFFSLQID